MKTKQLEIYEKDHKKLKKEKNKTGKPMIKIISDLIGALK